MNAMLTLACARRINARTMATKTAYTTMATTTETNACRPAKAKTKLTGTGRFLTIASQGQRL